MTVNEATRASRGAPPAKPDAARPRAPGEQPGDARSPGVPRGAAGAFTIIELIVSVSIMVIMMLGFSFIFSQSERAVKSAQRLIRANGEASAVAQVIRSDLACMTKEGFLAIVAPYPDNEIQQDTNRPPALVFTGVRPFLAKSVASGQTQANAAILCFSIRQDASTGNVKSVLCREANLLAGSGPPWQADVIGLCFSDLGRLNRQELVGGGGDPDIAAVDTFVAAYQSVPTRPTDLTQVQDAWPILVRQCDELSIQWLDASGNWYGFRYDDDNIPDNPDDPDQPNTLKIDPKDANWFGKDVTTGQVEFRHTTGAYVALWTHHSKASWPRAVKISFKIQGQTYEVICPIRQD